MSGEINILEQCVNMLDSQEAPAIQRIIHYLQSKYSAENAPLLIRRGRPTKKKRGRPAKIALIKTAAKRGPGRPAKKKRGRPAKLTSVTSDLSLNVPTKRGPGRPAKKKRGRPAKSSVLVSATVKSITKRGPGRPPKIKRGRPAKVKVETALVG